VRRKPASNLRDQRERRPALGQAGLLSREPARFGIPRHPRDCLVMLGWCPTLKEFGIKAERGPVTPISSTEPDALTRIYAAEQR
jgi:hypothetical protein